MASPTASSSPKRVKATEGRPFSNEDEVAAVVAPFAPKFIWFAERGYYPHLYQIAFHASHHHERLRRFRSLVAGRRGGKTLSAAWEVCYYSANPEQFHWDTKGIESDTPLHVWAVVPDYRSSGRAALLSLRTVLKEAGLIEGVDYKENRGDMYFEFTNGSLIEFKTAERPDKLVGAGIDIMWIDEAALIPDMEAWNIASPALADKLGIVICTTTPRGKNWFYELFWKGQMSIDPHVGTVEYRTIDNPHILAEEVGRYRAQYHPLMFKQEFLASFDSMAGKELQGDWLKYFTFERESTDEDVITIPRREEDKSKYALRTFIGVDPAVSLADEADRFAMALIGITEDNSQAYLLRLWAGRIPFHEQLLKISEWHGLYTPQYIGVESVAYQRVLADQAMRLPGMPNIIPMMATGPKQQRILSMAPLFQMGRIRIHPTQHADFIEEWLDYDSTKKNTKDDCLDAVEIALRVGGVLLPQMSVKEEDFSEGPQTLQEIAWARQGRRLRGENYDPDMGVDF